MAPQTPVQPFDAAVTAPALVERVQIVDASGNVLSTTTAPLAAGAATSAKQDAAKAVLDSLLAALEGTLTTSVSNFPATQPVSATSLPLPNGAATETTLSTLAKDNTLAALTRDGQLFTQDRHVRRLLEEVLLALQNQNSILLALASSVHAEVS